MKIKFPHYSNDLQKNACTQSTLHVLNKMSFNLDGLCEVGHIYVYHTYTFVQSVSITLKVCMLNSNPLWGILKIQQPLKVMIKFMAFSSFLWQPQYIYIYIK